MSENPEHAKHEVRIDSRAGKRYLLANAFCSIPAIVAFWFVVRSHGGPHFFWWLGVFLALTMLCGWFEWFLLRRYNCPECGHHISKPTEQPKGGAPLSLIIANDVILNGTRACDTQTSQTTDQPIGENCHEREGGTDADDVGDDRYWRARRPRHTCRNVCRRILRAWYAPSGFWGLGQRPYSNISVECSLQSVPSCGSARISASWRDCAYQPPVGVVRMWPTPRIYDSTRDNSRRRFRTFHYPARKSQIV